MLLGSNAIRIRLAIEYLSDSTKTRWGRAEKKAVTRRACRRLWLGDTGGIVFYAVEFLGLLDNEAKRAIF